MIRSLIFFCAPFLIGFLLSHLLRGWLPDETFVRFWMLLAILPITLSGLKRTFNDRPPREAAPDFSVHRLLNKSLALLIGWLFILGVASAGTRLGIEATTLFIDDFLFVFPFLAVGIPGYVLLSEWLTGIGDDDYSRFGAKLRTTEQTPWRLHKALLLSWAVKAFFVPLMYSWLHVALGQLLAMGPPTLNNWTVWLFNIGVSIDLLIGTAGYVFASKLFRSDVISVDDTWFGWLVCLICYPPLMEYLRLASSQVDSHVWTDWVEPSQPLYWIWACLIVTTWMIYWLSTVAFGLRFSNLSYRGLIDIGPYRWSKHPAYLSKNVYWWIHTVPFFGILGTAELARNIAGLSILSFVYFLRAKTEERHLSKFPEYRAYAHAIDKKFPWKYLRRNPARELQPFPH